jgi:8-oxo-dGTP diphosphatase
VTNERTVVDDREVGRMAEVTPVPPRAVFAAGGVVWRPLPRRAGAPGLAQREMPAPEIVLVHRPRYDDWTLPKGKLERGEHPLAAAVREVLEETGVRGIPQLRLPRIRYLTGQPGVEKVVDFWSMRAASLADRAPDAEVDEVRWIAAEQAPGLLTYAHDRGVVKAFVQRPLVQGLVVLVRHACAGERSEWTGPDEDRPLDDQGSADAARLSSVLAWLAPRRIVSARPLRCRQTVQPLADALGVPIETDAIFDEAADPARAMAALRGLASPDHPVVVCSQGKLIPPLLELVTGRAHQYFRTAKGTGWVVSFGADATAAVDYLDPDPDGHGAA